MTPIDLLREGQPFRQWKTWTIPGTRFTVEGYSRSSDKTFFHLPELKCCIDAGECAGRQADTVFLTHTHADHVSSIEYLASKDTGPDICAPAEACPFIDDYIRAVRQMGHVGLYDPSMRPAYRLHPMRGGESAVFGRLRVRAIPCVHKIPCIGYAFSEMRRRLKPEQEKLKAELLAQGKAAEFGRRMAEMRKAGEEPEEPYDAPLFAFMGDTHPSAFDLSPWLADWPVVFTECTFLHDTERERAARLGHTVWSVLRPVVESRPKTLFVLTHFSMRHTDREVVAFFDEERKKLPAGNVAVWAHGESLLPEQHQRRDEE